MTRSSAIIQFLGDMQAFGVQLHGLSVSLHGETLAEAAFAPFSLSKPHRLFSVSKSVVSLAIGLLAGDGKLRLTDRICDYFPEYTGPDTSPLVQAVTILDMLTMRTCYSSATYRPLLDANWTETWFRGKGDHVPGTLFFYDTSASQVLCALVEKLTGGDILTFLEKRLFGPLGMKGEKFWLKDPSGVSQGGTGLGMTLHDFATLTRFIASDGQGLISPEYLSAARSLKTGTSQRTGQEEKYGYGYQIWQTRHGFSLYGMGGQMGICIPEKQIVLCTTGDTMMSDQGVQPIYDAFFRHLSNLDAMPDSTGDRKELEETLRNLMAEPVHGAYQEQLDAVFPDSPFPFSRIRIEPDHILLDASGACWRLPFKQDAWTDGVFPQTDIPCHISAGWVSDTVFSLHTELTGTWTGGMQLMLHRKGDDVSLQIQSRIWELLPGWNGVTLGHTVS